MLKGFKHTDETKLKLSLVNKGKKLSDETKLKLSLVNKGKKLSDETKLKMSLSRKGKTHKGHKISDETKLKIGLGNKGKISLFKGKKRSEETKLKMSKTWNELYKNGYISPRQGYKHTDKTRKKISEGNKGKSKNVGHIVTNETRAKLRESNKGHIVTNETREKIKEARKHQTIPIKDTSIEIKIQKFLSQLKIEYFTHKYMHIEHGYQCDILIPIFKIIIECDGDYWHGNPLYFVELTKKQEKQKERDIIRTKELEEKGYKVIRLWESEINNMTCNELNNKIKDIIYGNKLY